MRRFASHGATFVVAALMGIAIGFLAAWRMGEPARLSWKHSRYFQVEAAAKIAEADALIERVCDVVEALEKGVGKPLDIYVKEYGADKLTILFDWKAQPSKAD